MKRSKHIVWALLFALAILVVLPSMYVSIRSSDPEFCLSCHYEKPFYDSWQQSTHSDIACIECHPNLRYRMPWLTFRYMMGLYDMQVHANVQTDTCLSCHEKEKLFAETVPVAGKKKSFSHKQHLSEPLRGVELRCASCHSHIVQGNHKSVEETVCFTCHFMGASPSDSITGCDACHGTPKETVARHGFSFNHDKYLKLGMSCGECHIKITEGTGQLQDGACHRCHVEPPAVPDTETVHNIHVSGQGIDCFECHHDIQHGGLEMVQTFNVACTDCHENLHSPQKAMYMGVGGEGIADYPSRMFAAQVTCDGCHIEKKEQRNAFKIESTRTPDAAACVTCHEPGYDTMLTDWQKAFRPMLSYVQRRIQTVSSRSNTEKSRNIVNTARHNFDLVRYGQPEHNVEYGVKLLQFTLDELDKVQARPKSERPQPLRAPDAYCASMCHNRLGMPEDLLFNDDIAFPHSTHMIAVGEDCGDCHSVEHHGETIITLNQCNTCHHVELPDASERCSDCHSTESGLYNGHLTDLEDGDPNYMVDMVGCTECHDVTMGDPITIDTVREACTMCHDEDYGIMLDDWVATGTDYRNDLKQKIGELEELAGQGKVVTKADSRTIEQAFQRIRIVYGIYRKQTYLHNPDYADTLYQQAVEDYETIRGLLQ